MPRLETITIRDDNPPRSWRDRARDAWRSFTLGPFNPRDPALADLYGGPPSSAGVSMDHRRALTLSAVYCAVTTISADIAALPLKLYRKRQDGGREPFEMHPLYRLLHDQANAQTTSYQFRQAMLMNVLLWGNAFAEIERDAAGRPAGLWHIAPERVHVLFAGNELRYRVTQPTGANLMFDASDLIHFRGPSPDGVLGLDVVKIARDAFGLAVAAEVYGSAYFRSGTAMGGLLTSPGSLTPEARKSLREAIELRHTGADRAHRLMLLENGLTYTATSTTPRDSQFQELRTHQIREVARFYKIPVALLGELERVTHNTHEEQTFAYYTQCLRPWLVNLEQELSMKLIASSERNQQSIEHSAEGLLRADVEKRGAYYAQMLTNGVMTANEVRALENLPPIAGGDVARVPMNTEPLKG